MLFVYYDITAQEPYTHMYIHPIPDLGRPEVIFQEQLVMTRMRKADKRRLHFSPPKFPHSYQGAGTG